MFTCSESPVCLLRSVQTVCSQTLNSSPGHRVWLMSPECLKTSLRVPECVQSRRDLRRMREEIVCLFVCLFVALVGISISVQLRKQDAPRQKGQRTDDGVMKEVNVSLIDDNALLKVSLCSASISAVPPWERRWCWAECWSMLSPAGGRREALLVLTVVLGYTAASPAEAKVCHWVTI